MSEQNFISSNMSRLLFDRGLSVPRLTVIPFSNISGSGANPPDASFMLDTGQWTALTPLFASVLISLIVSQTQCAAMPLSQRNPIFSSHSGGRRPYFSTWS